MAHAPPPPAVVGSAGAELVSFAAAAEPRFEQRSALRCMEHAETGHAYTGICSVWDMQRHLEHAASSAASRSSLAPHPVLLPMADALLLMCCSSCLGPLSVN
jgi:hypothetical protein